MLNTKLRNVEIFETLKVLVRLYSFYNNKKVIKKYIFIFVNQGWLDEFLLHVLFAVVNKDRQMAKSTLKKLNTQDDSASAR